MGKFKRKPKRYYSPEIFSQQIDKLRKLHGNISQDEFNRRIGVKQAATKWKAGTTTPSVDSLLAIKNTFGVSIDWLLTGEEPKGKEILQPIITVAGQYPRLPPEVIPDHYLAVPLVEGHIAAGYAGAIPAEEIKSLVYIYRPQVGRRQEHPLMAVQVGPDYHSMEPTIRAGDIVIVDPYDLEVVPGGIYAVRLEPEGCAVKRVCRSDEYLVLLSDNPGPLPEYQPLVVPPERSENLLIGRVIWSWTSWVK